MTLPTFLGSAPGIRLLALGIFAPVMACLLPDLICRITPHASAAARHLVWLLAFVAMAVCLPITLLNMRVTLPILPASPAPHASPSPVPSGAPVESAEPRGGPETRARPATPAEGVGFTPPAPLSTASLRRQIRWKPLVPWLWAFGFVFQSFISFAGTLRLKGIITRSRFCDDSRLMALWIELCPPAARRLLGRLLLSSEVKVPLVASWWRPFVILPDTARQWPSPMLRTAFVHELAHIERNDLWWSAFARWVASLYWFNPVAWYGLRRLQAESEMAADDRVVVAGLPPVDYAEDLLLLVRAHRQSEGSLFPAIGMARARGIEARVARILDPSPRRLAPNKLVRRAALWGAVLITIGALMIRLVAAPPPAQAGSTAVAETNGPRTGADSASQALAEKPAKGINADSIEVTLIPDKTKVMVGEPVFLSYIVRNKTPADLQVLVGGDCQNELGRPGTFTVTTLDEHGHPVAQPVTTMDFGGMEWPQRIPASGTYAFRLFLPHWATIDQPGHYTIVAKRILKLRKSSANTDTWLHKTPDLPGEARNEIEVVPLDKAALGKIIDDLGAKLLAQMNRSDAGEPGIALQAVRDERVIPHFISALHTDDYSLKFTALKALSTFNSDPALEGLLEGMKTTGQDFGNGATGADADQLADNIRYAAAIGLAKSPHPAALEALLDQRRDSYYAIRSAVVMALGTRFPKDHAIPMLRAMADDSNEMIRVEVKRYLELLGAGP